MRIRKHFLAVMATLPALFMHTGAVQAACPVSMDVDTLVECIIIEGSDTNYQVWKKEYELIGTGRSRDEDPSAHVTAEDFKRYHRWFASENHATN